MRFLSGSISLVYMFIDYILIATKRIKYCKAHSCTYIPFVRCVSVYTGAALMRVCMYVMYKRKEQEHEVIMFSRHVLYNYFIHM